jgi:hypothetical protein
MFMRRSLSVLLLMAVLVAGCAQRGAKPDPQAGKPQVEAPGSQPGGQPGTQPGRQPGGGEPLAGPDLTTVQDPFTLTVAEFQAGLRRLANSSPTDVTVAGKVEDVLNRWSLQAREGAVRLAEPDLNGDGTPEVVLAFNSQTPQPSIVGQGALFVIHRQGDRWEVDRTEGEQPGMALHGAYDLTGDDRRELVVSSMEVGAHTAYGTARVYTWEPGRLAELPGTMRMASMRVNVDASDLVLRGGLIGSVGAGMAQREREDRYRWNGSAIVQTDRWFEDSPFGYHYLQDGITAEQFGRTDVAVVAYTHALDRAKEAAPAAWLPPETADRFPDAVRAFARIRLAALYLEEGRTAAEVDALIAGAEGRYAGLVAAVGKATSREEACSAAQTWATASGAEFLEVINSPVGYANPQWQPSTLCGALPVEM